VSLSCEVAVLGLGAMGSAALLELSRRGVRVIGFDRHTPPHALGSTHGKSRIIREAYYEDPAYVPLVQRAYERWALLEQETGTTVFRQTGGLSLGHADGTLVSGARRSAQLHGLPFEELDSKDIARRFPAFRATEGTAAIFEPRAGVLDPEACVSAMLARAAGLGARIEAGVVVDRWEPAGSGIRLETSQGPVECGSLVVAAGPWLPGLIQGRLPLRVERQVMFWFHPVAGASVGPERVPVFIWEWSPDRYCYGIPDVGDGLKIARHHEGQDTDPDRVQRDVSEEEIGDARKLVQRLLPDAGGEFAGSAVCMYTDTPDFHFVIGLDPASPKVTVVSPCSGHGFKFASAIGEIAADLATTGSTRFDLTPFSPARFNR
jgi:sarcosine oxidase